MKHVFHQQSVLRIYGMAAIVTIAALAAVTVLSGVQALFAVFVLAIIEVTFSFENAVVNAKVLSTMPRIWQTIFLTIGIAFAVFGMRLILPLLLVSVTAGLGVGQVFDLALHYPEQYAEQLRHAHPVISAAGGIFLMMIFLHFLFEQREIHWIDRLERPLRQLDSVWVVPIALAVVILGVVTAAFGGEDSSRVLGAGFGGLTAYLAIKYLSDRFRQSSDMVEKQGGAAILKAGLFSFLYLELLDASFSFDGVIAAFAITDNVLLIAAGLGIGAIYVRSMTIHLLRRGTLQNFVYLEHGAYYAVGALATVLLIGLGYKIPSFITGLFGIAIIALAIVSSLRDKRQRPALTGANVI